MRSPESYPETSADDSSETESITLTSVNVKVDL